MLLFLCVDFDKDTADKTLITLFLSYLYEFAAKGSSATIVKKEVISPFETSLMTEVTLIRLI